MGFQLLTTKNMDYQQKVQEFFTKYSGADYTMDPEEMGAFMLVLANYYAEFNMKLVVAQKDLSLVSRDIAERTDDNGKVITSAKADTFIAATEEANKYRTLKAHVQNIEQYISSVRALQKGSMKEYNYMGNT